MGESAPIAHTNPLAPTDMPWWFLDGRVSDLIGVETNPLLRRAGVNRMQFCHEVDARSERLEFENPRPPFGARACFATLPDKPPLAYLACCAF